MIKIVFPVSLLIFSCCCMAQGENANITVTGKIKASACMVDVDSKSFTVEMGKHKTNEFKNVGDSTSPVNFEILLTECPATTTKALIKLDGIADANNPNLIRIDSGEGTAQGIGIAVYDSKGNILPLWTGSSWYELQKGDNTLSFTARYMATQIPTTPGIANASSDFTVNYK